MAEDMRAAHLANLGHVLADVRTWEDVEGRVRRTEHIGAVLLAGLHNAHGPQPERLGALGCRSRGEPGDALEHRGPRRLELGSLAAGPVDAVKSERRNGVLADHGIEYGAKHEGQDALHHELGAAKIGEGDAGKEELGLPLHRDTIAASERRRAHAKHAPGARCAR